MKFEPTHTIDLESGESLPVQAVKDGTDGLLLFTQSEIEALEIEPQWQTDMDGMLIKDGRYFEGAKLVKYGAI